MWPSLSDVVASLLIVCSFCVVPLVSIGLIGYVALNRKWSLPLVALVIALLVVGLWIGIVLLLNAQSGYA